MKIKSIILPLFAVFALAVSPVSFADECPLCDPALFGDVAEVRRLLDVGANPNAADDGFTALMWATYKGHAEIAEILLAAGANPNAAKDDGATALMPATFFGHTEIVNMLLSAGANPNAVSNDGWTPLMGAVIEGHAETAKVLLEAGANLDAISNDGLTILMAAAHTGNADIVKISLGLDINPILRWFSDYADVNAQDNKGRTALDYAKKAEHLGIVRILKEAGAKE